MQLPSGMSSYQADWYIDEEGEFEDDAEGEDEEDDGDSITIGSIGRAMNPAQAIAEKKMMMTTIREQVIIILVCINNTYVIKTLMQPQYCY